MSRWGIVNFGEHKGKTLLQILCNDPGWFFLAYRNSTIKPRLGLVAKELYDKATHIKIPNNDDGRLMVEYLKDKDTGKFLRFDVVHSDDGDDEESSRIFRKKYIDMSVPSSSGKRDIRGNKLFLRCLRYHLFGNESARLTERRCEEFFEDSRNFDLESSDIHG